MYKQKIIAIQSDIKEDVERELLNYHHDHCSTLFYGRMENLPKKFKGCFNNTRGIYAVIFSEDIPEI